MTKLAILLDETCEFPYIDHPATVMLRDATNKLLHGNNLSVRRFAASLGIDANQYGHMMNGRAPVPPKHIPILLDHLPLDRHEFFYAVIEQRYPELVGFRV